MGCLGGSSAPHGVISMTAMSGTQLCTHPCPSPRAVSFSQASLHSHRLARTSLKHGSGVLRGSITSRPKAQALIKAILGSCLLKVSLAKGRRVVKTTAAVGGTSQGRRLGEAGFLGGHSLPQCNSLPQLPSFPEDS